jgi:hypothetical protein
MFTVSDKPCEQLGPLAAVCSVWLHRRGSEILRCEAENNRVGDTLQKVDSLNTWIKAGDYQPGDILEFTGVNEQSSDILLIAYE